MSDEKDEASELGELLATLPEWVYSWLEVQAAEQGCTVEQMGAALIEESYRNREAH